jgi:hypothetical protein
MKPGRDAVSRIAVLRSIFFMKPGRDAASGIALLRSIRFMVFSLTPEISDLKFQI